MSVPGHVTEIPIDKVVPNGWNPNKQTKKEFAALKKKIQDVGFLEPIQVVPLDSDVSEAYMILGGEHRWRAAQELEFEKIPAVVLTDERFQSGDLQRFITMQLNTLRGRTDPKKFTELYRELRDRYSDSSMADLMGFTRQHAFKSLVGEVAEGMPSEMGNEFKERAKKAKTTSHLQQIVQDLVGRYGEDLDLNFMVLSHEGRNHLWLRLDEDTYEVMLELLDACRARALDVNEALRHVAREAVESLG